MKKLMTLTVVLFVATVKIWAQDDIQKIQEAWGKDKKELMRIGMALSAADSVKFWPVYEQYETERKKLGRERLVILDDYAANYATITNAKADEIIQRIFKNEAALSKLQQDFYNRFKTSVSAMQAAKFLHIENYLQSTVRSLIQGSLPVIGQLDSLKTQKM